MKTIYIVSTEPFSGKGWITLMLGLKFKENGLKIGYFRPLGTIPIKIDDSLIDEDAFYFDKTLGLNLDKKLISPVLMTDKSVEQIVSEQKEENKNLDRYFKKVVQAYKKISIGKNVFIIGGAGSLFTTGMIFNLDVLRLSNEFNAKVLVVVKYGNYMIDSILASKKLLNNRMIGVVFNSIPEEKIEYMKKYAVPYLRKKGIEVFGLIPFSNILCSISVKELVDNLFCEVVCGKDKIDNLVQHFCVGAMNVNSALKYFRQLSNKAVITGGDRSDIQLAALETPTVCLILTGNLYPNSAIIGKAESLGVPILLVKNDTLSTVEKIERLLVHIPVKGKQKLNHAKLLFDKYFDYKKFYHSL